MTTPDLVEVVAKAIWDAWTKSAVAPEKFREVSWADLGETARDHPDAMAPKAMIAAAHDEARASLAAIEAAGFVVVPKERIAAQKDAAYKAMGKLNCAIWRAQYISQWHADPNCDVPARANEVVARARDAKAVLVGAFSDAARPQGDETVPGEAP